MSKGSVFQLFFYIGYILHRRCVPSNNSNESVYEETVVYKSPFYIQNEDLLKSSLTSFHKNDDNKIYRIYDNHKESHKAILESSIVDNIELIAHGCINSSLSNKNISKRYCSLHQIPHELLFQMEAQSISLPISWNDIDKKLWTILPSKKRSPLSEAQTSYDLSFLTNHQDNELIDLHQSNQINDNLTNSESDTISNYKETNQKLSSLLRLNEQYSSAFIDDDDSYYCRNNLMKTMLLNKTNPSDERTITSSVSLNTYSQDYSINKIFHQLSLNQQSSRDSWFSSSSSSSQDRPIPQQLSAAIDNQRNTSSDSDAITTAATTLTTSTLREG